MEEYYWDKQINYLMNSRALYFNDDYIEFLIKKVWNFTRPIHIVDFGCGLGFIGLKFLPYLPKGSKYTGIDKGEELIVRAKDVFSKLPYESEFLVDDINQIKLEHMKYDVAICQAVLLHLTNPKDILQKMIKSVKNNGRIICIEPHRISAMANSYIDELETSKVANLGILQKLYYNNSKSSGKDGNIGIKIPVFMKELGLEDIQSRTSDCVNYLNPELESKEMNRIYESLCSEGFCPPKVIDKRKFIENLMDRGLTQEEANQQLEIEMNLTEKLNDNWMNYNILFAPTMMISYGTRVIEKKY